MACHTGSPAQDVRSKKSLSGHTHNDLLPLTRLHLPASHLAMSSSVEESTDGYHTSVIQSSPKANLWTHEALGEHVDTNHDKNWFLWIFCRFLQRKHILHYKSSEEISYLFLIMLFRSSSSTYSYFQSQFTGHFLRDIFLNLIHSKSKWAQLLPAFLTPVLLLRIIELYYNCLFNCPYIQDF